MIDRQELLGSMDLTEIPYLSDIETILSHRHDNGWDLWATPDKRLLKGSPFSTFDCALYLLELGIYPCQTAMAAGGETNSPSAGDLRPNIPILTRHFRFSTLFGSVIFKSRRKSSTERWIFCWSTG